VAVNLDGQTRQDETIEMDGGSFTGAQLIRCRLVYRGAHSAYRQPHSHRIPMGLQGRGGDNPRDAVGHWAR
jgi:hypothetical protein